MHTALPRGRDRSPHGAAPQPCWASASAVRRGRGCGAKQALEAAWSGVWGAARLGTGPGNRGNIPQMAGTKTFASTKILT